MTTNAPYFLPPNPNSNGQPVTVEGNIQFALQQTSGMNAMQVLGWFYQQVQGDVPMDYKSTKRYPEYGNSPASQDFGNFNYGAVGAALGIPPALLETAASWQQIKTDAPRLLSDDDSPKGSMMPWDENFGDALGDQWKIKEGVKWAEDSGFVSPNSIPKEVANDFFRELFRNLGNSYAAIKDLAM